MGVSSFVFTVASEGETKKCSQTGAEITF